MRAFAALLLGLWAAPSLAQDAAEGRRMAEQWCANCHRVAAGGPGPATDAAPAFAAIAARPGVNAEGLSAYIRAPHGAMPDHGLTPRQSLDLAAHILAQRPR